MAGTAFLKCALASVRKCRRAPTSLLSLMLWAAKRRISEGSGTASPTFSTALHGFCAQPMMSRISAWQFKAEGLGDGRQTTRRGVFAGARRSFSPAGDAGPRRQTGCVAGAPAKAQMIHNWLSRNGLRSANRSGPSYRASRQGSCVPLCYPRPVRVWSEGSDRHCPSDSRRVRRLSRRPATPRSQRFPAGHGVKSPRSGFFHLVPLRWPIQGKVAGNA
jgi:hypothetical protein